MRYRLDTAGLAAVPENAPRVPGEKTLWLLGAPADRPAKGGAPDPAVETGIPETLLQRALENPYPRFESHEGLDMLCVRVADGPVAAEDSGSVLHIFLTADDLVLFCGDEAYRATLETRLCQQADAPAESFGRILARLFEQILDGDRAALERQEERIMQLEREIIVERQRGDYVRRIIMLRRRLLHLSRYYTQLIETMEYLLLNENKLLDTRAAKLLKIEKSRAARLLASVSAQTEYVTQIREAYQSQVDISLNKTMKVFTVLTAIFLPLSLIAGWYGMNFNMPEYQSPWGYPLVIAVSVLTVGLCVFLFRKNKWF